MRAEKLQYKAAQVGFDWPEIGAVEKFKEEVDELIQAPEAEIEEEIGDMLLPWLM